jgi:hypothetical protein
MSLDIGHCVKAYLIHRLARMHLRLEYDLFEKFVDLFCVTDAFGEDC